MKLQQHCLILILKVVCIFMYTVADLADAIKNLKKGKILQVEWINW